MQIPPFIVGITGASGSGKTSFLNQLYQEFDSKMLCLVAQDNYYRPLEEQQKDQRGIVNFDLPSAIDLDHYSQDIAQLKKGKAVSIREYNFNNPNQAGRLLKINPAPIIIVEGLFIFHSQELRELFDLKVYIDVEDHIRLKRRIIRDNEERGQDLNDVLYRYEYHVFPAYQQYIVPHKYESDIIIPNNHNFEKGLSVLVAFLKDKLRTYEC